MSSSSLRQLSRRRRRAGRSALRREAFGDDEQIDAEEIRSWLRNEELRAGLAAGAGPGRQRRRLRRHLASGATSSPSTSPRRVGWDAFFDWAEAAGRERGLPRVCVDVRRPGTRSRDRCRLAATGYGARRSRWRSTSTTRPADCAAGRISTLRTVRRSSTPRRCAQALNEAFALTTRSGTTSRRASFREFYLRARGFDPSLWLLAWRGDELVGLGARLSGARRRRDARLGGHARRSCASGVGAGSVRHCSSAPSPRSTTAGFRRSASGSTRRTPTGALGLYERAGMRKSSPVRQLGARPVSALRARCPGLPHDDSGGDRPGVPVP